MTKSVVSVKAMVETYVNFELDEKTWVMFYNMRCHDLISHDTWTKFYTKCKGWTLTDNGEAVIDTDNDNKILYKRDSNGFLVKA